MHHPALQKARCELQKFEKSATEAVGREALADALAELVDLQTSQPEERVRIVSQNLINTYRTKVEKEASRLLREKATLSWQSILHWHGVMGEFEDLELQVPDSFRTLRSQLYFDAVLKQVHELNPYERQSLIKSLESQAGEAQ